MNLQLFWHVALMGRWRQIVPEQHALFQRLGLRPKVGAVGLRRMRLLRAIGELVYFSPNTREYETPTLQKLWEWCISLPDPHRHAVLYCHTKAVAHHRDGRGDLWRQLMHRWVVERWRENLALLAKHDVVGFVHNARNPTGDYTAHFAGNFWMARADWIVKLPPPEVYSEHHRPRRRRFAPEMWVCCRPGYRYVSLCAENYLVARRRNVYRLARIPVP